MDLETKVLLKILNDRNQKKQFSIINPKEFGISYPQFSSWCKLWASEKAFGDDKGYYSGFFYDTKDKEETFYFCWNEESRSFFHKYLNNLI